MLYKAKKSFGQNFLKSKGAIHTLCTAGALNDGDTVVEIGPGKGALTEVILQKAKKVFAIEKDRDLIPILEEKFKDEIKSGQLSIVQADILQFDPDYFKIKDYKVIANIPYNITGAIIEHFLTCHNQPQVISILVQKEVAERIVARDNKESILSMSVRAYGTPKYITKVSRKYFSPSPRVDSAIISITDISKRNFKNQKEEDNFFLVVKAGFAHKRKVLKGNLGILFDKDTLDTVYKDLSLSPNTRAEEVKISIWLKIASYL